MNEQFRNPACQHSHATRLDRLAEVAVRVGLGLEARAGSGHDRAARGAPLVRRITEHAYKAGASLVTTLFSDEESTLLRFRHARGRELRRGDRLAL